VSPRRIAAAFVFAIAFVAPLGAQSPTSPSLTNAMKLTVDSGDGRTVEMTMRMRVRDGRVRMEVEGEITAMAPGMFQIIDTKQQTMTSVMPSQKMAMVIPLTSLAALNKVTAAATLVGTPVVQVEELGAGEPIIGHPTRRIRTTLDYTLSYPFPSGACPKRINSVTEEWIASDLKDIVPMMRNGASLVPEDAVSPAQTEIMKRIVGLQKGVALRAISRETLPTGKVVTMKTDVTEWSIAPIDSTAFQVPAGMSVMDMASMGGMPDAATMVEMSRKQYCK
jgi:hypothetical protein